MSNNNSVVEEICKSCKCSYYPWCIVHSCRDCPNSDGEGGCKCCEAIKNGKCSNYVEREDE